MDRWDPMGPDGSAQLPLLQSPGRWCIEDVPQDCIGYVTGNRRAALGGIEEVPASPLDHDALKYEVLSVFHCR